MFLEQGTLYTLQLIYLPTLLHSYMMWIAVKHGEYFAGNDIGFHLFVAQILHSTCNIIVYVLE